MCKSTPPQPSYSALVALGKKKCAVELDTQTWTATPVIARPLPCLRGNRKGEARQSMASKSRV